MNPDDAVWILAIGVAAGLSWLPHLVYSWRRYRRPEAFPNPKFAPFRALFVAIMIELAFLSAVASTIIRAWPGTEWLNGPSSVVRIITLALLLSGGLVLWAAWRLERRRA